MSIIFVILFIVVIILATLLIAGLFMKKEFLIERDILIHQPKEEVFNYLKLLKNAEQYNKWVMTDPAMKKTLTGTDGRIGFIYAWDSTNKQVGKGEQEIIKLNEGERIDYEIRFIKPFEGTSYASLITTAVSSDQTKVMWLFNGKMEYPMNILHKLLNLSKVLGNDLQTSLNTLKTVLEKNKL